MKTYIGDEAALTGHLTAEEFGAYERLRRHYWQHGGLPNDDARLMRVTGVAPDRWTEVRSGICDLFDDGWHLPKLDEMRADAAEKRERKVAAGRKGADKRWSKDSRTIGRTNANAIGKRMAGSMTEPMDNQWPPAPAPDEVRYEERLAPTRTYARTRESRPGCFSIPETDSEGRAFLRRHDLQPRQVERALPMLMEGRLDQSILDQIMMQ
ncbi:DUF1376 domain-containing protein [Jiella mangrovi]|uniref:YdaU family protein n=1 Tax=Jiella mangrovi TaxID=2821407 RepID=A0ABS4BC17_9HYPH|nr:DUF1376 domain-containing protein [Jiella mangrovi]MBP0614292.1 YdaU family protein [Jiella mangrovi]